MANFYPPNTAVHLCNVPLNINQKNQFVAYTNSTTGSVWNNGTGTGSQYEWFANHITHTFTDFTYQRKDNIIRIPINAEILYADGSNYVMYQNKHYGSKWFYCFIELIEFVNENCTHLHIKTDVFQTWFFEMYKNNHMDINYIVRETVLNDDLFKHTLPENICGEMEMTCDGAHAFKLHDEDVDTNSNKLLANNTTSFNANYWACVISSERIKDISDSVGFSNFIAGVPSSAIIYACDLIGYNSLIKTINENGQADAIVKCVAIPKFLAKYTALVGGGDEPITPQPPSQSGLHLNSPFSGAFHIEQTYGWQSDNTWHDGIDMWSTTADNNVYSTVKGTVVYSAFHTSERPGGSFGELVCIKDDVTGYYFLFGHLAENSRGVLYGQRVNIGDFLGVTGTTGSSTGVHLHYEVNTTDMWSNSVSPTSVANAQFPNTYGDY